MRIAARPKAKASWLTPAAEAILDAVGSIVGVAVGAGIGTAVGTGTGTAVGTGVGRGDTVGKFKPPNFFSYLDSFQTRVWPWQSESVIFINTN